MASTRTSTYSPIDVTIVISQESTGLVHVVSGFVEDSHINIERDAETYTHYTGVDNTSTRIYNAITSGKVTASLTQSSASNDVLSALYNYDKQYRGTNKGLFSLTVKDGSGRSIMFAQEAYVGVVPNQQFGSGMNNRDWVFHCTQMDNYIGGNSLVSPEDAAGIDLLDGNLADEWRL
jgi:hypothetical protein